MNRIRNIFIIIVLCAILIKLSLVFWFMFEKLDTILGKDTWIGKITGIAFAFSSILFVIKKERLWLKITMVALDGATILYYYWHDLFKLDIRYIAPVVAIYCILIVFFLGDTISTQIDSDSATIRLRKIENRQRIDSERLSIEREIVRVNRCFRQCKPGETKDGHERHLQELKEKLEQLN